MNPAENTWAQARERWHIGQVVEVTVTKHVPFGVFVDLPDGVLGLIENPNLAAKATPPERALPPLGTRLDAVIVDFVDRHEQVRLSIRPDHLAAAWRGNPTTG